MRLSIDCTGLLKTFSRSEEIIIYTLCFVYLWDIVYTTLMNLIILYLGLVLVAIGMIMTSMGTGDRDKMQGYLSTHLKMMGPIMVLLGGFISIIRIGFMFQTVRNIFGLDKKPVLEVNS